MHRWQNHWQVTTWCTGAAIASSRLMFHGSSNDRIDSVRFPNALQILIFHFELRVFQPTYFLFIPFSYFKKPIILIKQCSKNFYAYAYVAKRLHAIWTCFAMWYDAIDHVGIAFTYKELSREKWTEQCLGCRQASLVEWTCNSIVGGCNVQIVQHGFNTTQIWAANESFTSCSFSTKWVRDVQSLPFEPHW